MEDILHNMDWVLSLRSPAATVVFRAFTWLGYAPFFLLFLPLGYWLWDKAVFTRLAMLVLMTGILNAFLKDLFQDPRPDAVYALDSRVARSYGMPSGHAQVAVVLWFWLAHEIRRWWAVAGAAVLVSGIVLSRLYLGVHDVEDVLAGVVLGVGCLLLFRVLVSPRFDSWRSLNPSVQIGVVLLLQLAVFGMWPGDAGPGRALSSAGFMMGWFGGAALDRALIRYEKSRRFGPTVVGALLGVTCIFLLLFWDRAAAGPAPLGLGWLRYLKAAFLGVVVTALIPVGFQVLRLGSRSEPPTPGAPRNS